MRFIISTPTYLSWSKSRTVGYLWILREHSNYVLIIVEQKILDLGCHIHYLQKTYEENVMPQGVLWQN